MITKLLDEVLQQMQKDFDNQDVTAIAELLENIPHKYLVGYLPEEVQKNGTF